jgi:hypothetical protein
VALVVLAGPGQVRVGLVHVDRRAGVAPHPVGDPHVVHMRVGQDHRLDVAQRAADRRQIGLELAAMGGQPGVDDRQPAAVVDEVQVHEVVSEAVHALGDLGGSTGHARTLRSGVFAPLPTAPTAP